MTASHHEGPSWLVGRHGLASGVRARRRTLTGAQRQSALRNALPCRNRLRRLRADRQTEL